MGRPCKICTQVGRELLLRINNDVVGGKPLNEIYNDYQLKSQHNISYQSLRRHSMNHTKRQAARIKKDLFVTEGMKKDMQKTVDYLNDMIKGYFADPDNLKIIGPQVIIQALKFRSQLLGEQVGPERVEIRWGAGLKDLKENKGDEITITIPIESKKQKGGREKVISDSDNEGDEDND